MATILVVDDDARVRRLIRFAAEARGHRVLEAASGNDGLGMLTNEGPDLGILDVDMPGPSGLDVCRTIRARAEHGDLPIIVLTGSARIAEEDAFAAGASALMTKPFSPGALLDAVAALVER